MAKIFISYRRNDSMDIVGRIYDHLSYKLGKKNVFKDIDSIELGTDFRKTIEDYINTCDAVLVIIGNQWLHQTNESGERRIDELNDLVRIEIEIGLERGIQVIPVLVYGAEMPHKEELPLSIRQLSSQNGLSVRADPDFVNDINTLVKSLGLNNNNYKYLYIILIPILVISFLLYKSIIPHIGNLIESSKKVTKQENVDNDISNSNGDVETPCISLNTLHNTNSNLDLDTVPIPKGKYILGGKTKVNSIREQTVSSFLVDRFEVTNKQYKSFVVKNIGKLGEKILPKNWNGISYKHGNDFYPVTNIDWHSAKSYCESIEKRLPTSIEWEVACSYNMLTTNEDLGCGVFDIVGNYTSEKKPEIFNLMNNISEWTNDIKILKFNPSNPNSKTGQIALVKGNNYTNTNLSCAGGLTNKASTTTNIIGFRCVK